MLPSKPASPAATPAFLALGSNLGDRVGHLRAAVAELRTVGRVFAVSSAYATAPVGMPEAPEFLNAVLGLETNLPPEALLEFCLAVEARRGRSRPGAAGWSSRTLDIDLLSYGALRRNDSALRLPHPRALDRAFVLVPWAEIAPDFIVDGRSVAEWAAGLDRSGVRPILPARDWAG